jgi:hypothetical protein
MDVPVVTVPLGEIARLKLVARLGGATTVTVNAAVPVSRELRTVEGS